MYVTPSGEGLIKEEASLGSASPLNPASYWDAPQPGEGAL